MTQPIYSFAKLIADGKATVSKINEEEFEITYKRYDISYGKELPETDKEMVRLDNLNEEIAMLEKHKASFDEKIKWLQEQVVEIEKVKVAEAKKI